MDYRRLGSTGLKVSPLCMGTMQFGWSVNEADTRRILSATLDAGINFLDTADVYSRWVEGNPGGVAETHVGNWMKNARVTRDRVVLATKVRGEMGPGPNDRGLGRVHMMQAVEASLRRLQTDYIDLYQAHWSDPETPIEETMRAFDDLVRQGKVRYVGASNYKAWELMQALWTSDRHGLARYVCLQPHHNLIWRSEFEAELRDVCSAYGLGVIPYSPLAGGLLTGKYRKDKPLPESARAESRKRHMTDANLAVLAKVDEVAATHHATPAQVALAWLLADPVITSPIIGATSLEQLKENLGALEVKLGSEDMAALNEATAWKTKPEG